MMQEKNLDLIMFSLMMITFCTKINNEVKVYYDLQLIAVNVYGKNFMIDILCF